MRKDNHRFREICEICPDIAYLDWFTRQFSGRKGFCANAVIFSFIKPIVNELVGWHAENPALRFSRDYDVVYWHLYHNLPDCNHEDQMCRWNLTLRKFKVDRVA